MKIIDSHCHVYPDAIAPKAVKGISSFYDGIEGYSDGTTGTLKREGLRLGIDHAVIFSVATTPRQVPSINTFISEVVKTGEGYFTGLGSVHPDSEDIPGLVSAIVSLGLKGVKIHPDFQNAALDDPRWFPLYEEAARLSLPVLTHCGDLRYDYSNPERMKRTLDMFPHTFFIGAHMGGWSKWDEALEKLHGYDNFVVDTSSTRAWTTLEAAERYVKGYGSERVLFASDSPMGSQEKEIAFIDGMKLSPREKENIFFRNAERVFGI